MRRAGWTHGLAVATATAALYLAALAAGLWLQHSGHTWATLPGWSQLWAQAMGRRPQAAAWRAASLDQLPSPQRERVELGARLFDETPVYLAGHVQARLACASCHIQGGIAPLGLAVVGSAHTFPQYSARARRTITLVDRVQECMVRSENGRPLDPRGPAMQAIVAYIDWLSQPHPGQARFAGRGLQQLPRLQPDAARGATLYAAQCAGCHGDDGQGTRRPFPPLWGSTSFNDGAGMDTLPKLAAFIHTNMPQNRPGILTAQQAWDLAAYVQQQPRPALDKRFAAY